MVRSNKITIIGVEKNTVYSLEIKYFQDNILHINITQYILQNKI